MRTTFFRLLAADDKAVALASTTATTCTGEPRSDVYAVDPTSFGLVPGSPFAYWVPESTRSLFASLPNFESSQIHVQSTNPLNNDARYFRLAWEVDASKAGKGKEWAPLAKGGQYSHYYSDIHLVANWDESEQTYRGFEGTINRPLKRPASVDYFFRPGLTWPRRTIAGLSVRTMPTGCIFGDKGPAMFIDGDSVTTSLVLLALVNSAPFRYLFSLQVPSSSFEVGLMQRMPLPQGLEAADSLAIRARMAHDLKRDHDRDDEATHPFSMPAFVRLRQHATLAEAGAAVAAENLALQSRLMEIQRDIDDRVCDLYGFSATDRARAKVSDELIPTGVTVVAVDAETGENDETSSDAEQVPHLQGACADLTAYAVGCAFGRWDIRIGRDPTLAPRLADPFAPLPVCAPGALVGPDALPAIPGRIVSEEWLRARPDAITRPPECSVRQATIPDADYPILIPWDGILVDDPDHPADIVRRVRAVLGVLWPGDNGAQAEAIEREACQILGVADLRDYVRHPASFFADHLKRYSKSRRQAPIYWPLSTASGAYTLWIYYHRLTSDTLYTAVNRYVEPKIAEVQRRLADDERALEGASGREASRLRDALQTGRDFLSELRDFRAELMRIAALPYRPDLNDGVIITAAPLHRLFRLTRWAKDTKACWEKLTRGDYDWAHLALTLWPERVRAKCASDKSLAIAHDLEDLYVAPPAAAKKGRGRKPVPPPQDELPKAADDEEGDEGEVEEEE